MSGIRVTGIDHVQVVMPADGEAAARAFYAGILGLREVPKPTPLERNGGCWFVGTADPQLSIHVGVQEPFAASRKAHIALLIDGLDALRAALDAAGAETRDDEADIGVRRFYAFDPFGNRLELIDALDAGFSNRSG